MSTLTTLTMLNEIECKINNYLEVFKDYTVDKKDAAIFSQIQSEIKNEARQTNRNQNLKAEQERIEKANLERQLAREQKNFKKVGKMAMCKIWVPAQKKVQEKKKTYTPEQEDFINYGLK
eukprot:CAMPEP_0168615886 /NCGR_PEP_ID=MMETSP0449_2-20121227/4736_1 /TAXON_ID=1082188 /ORGANISM="Strombidium rassoulzadegani, Strain ras09" /LENGTH=119 /DNA_ID=CAMNT_0008656641 /DNA_START=115 /DNA_END=471 /DNA_ORIENTATION=+